MYLIIYIYTRTSTIFPSTVCRNASSCPLPSKEKMYDLKLTWKTIHIDTNIYLNIYIYTRSPLRSFRPWSLETPPVAPLPPKRICTI